MTRISGIFVCGLLHWRRVRGVRCRKMGQFARTCSRDARSPHTARRGAMHPRERMKGRRKEEGGKRKGEWKVKLVGKNNTHRSSSSGNGGGIAHSASEKTFLLPPSLPRPLSFQSDRPTGHPSFSTAGQSYLDFYCPQTNELAAEQTNGEDRKPKHG